MSLTPCHCIVPAGFKTSQSGWCWHARMCLETVFQRVKKWPRVINFWNLKARRPPPPSPLDPHPLLTVNVKQTRSAPTFTVATGLLSVVRVFWLFQFTAGPVVYAAVYPSVSFGVIFCFASLYIGEGGAEGLLSERAWTLLAVVSRECQAQIRVIIERLFKWRPFKIPLRLLNESVPFPYFREKRWNAQATLCIYVYVSIEASVSLSNKQNQNQIRTKQYVKNRNQH